MCSLFVDSSSKGRLACRNESSQNQDSQSNSHSSRNGPLPPKGHVTPMALGERDQRRTKTSPHTCSQVTWSCSYFLLPFLMFNGTKPPSSVGGFQFVCLGFVLFFFAFESSILTYCFPICSLSHPLFFLSQVQLFYSCYLNKCLSIETVAFDKRE